MVALLAIALSAAAALIVLTTRLHRATARLGTAMENVQLAEEALLDLRAIDAMMAHLRAVQTADEDGAALRGAVARRTDALRARFAELQGRADTPGARELLDASRASVERYVELAGRAPSSPDTVQEERTAFEDSRGPMRRYLELNVERARGARANAARWDRTADRWGLGAATLLVVGTGVVLAFLRTLLFTPIVTLADGISRYGRGDDHARVPEVGFEELRHVARSFNDVADRLERQREDQLAFLGGVAHDLRNPLSAIRLACRSFPGSSPGADRIRSRLEMIDRQVMKLDRMAADFLDAARAEAGRLEITPEPHDLRAIVRTAVDVLAGTSTLHELRLSEPPVPAVVPCDAGRIEQVVVNLLSNAYKYSPERGRIWVTLRRDGSDAVVSVEDEGIGIAPEDLARIFEPFRRGSRLTKAVPGLGLGLATARRIAERHGGTLTVSSSTGRGSTFELRLPLQVPEPSGPRHECGAGASPPDQRGASARAAAPAARR